MKKLSFLFAFVCTTGTLFSQTLFTYGNTAVDKAEFLKAYNKNKTAVTDKEASLKEYLDLYIKFKLKVKAAQELRLDTLAQLRADLDNFRSQVDESYMNNEKAVNALVDEAFARSQKDIHVYHFFVPLDQNAIAADSIKAYQALNDVYGKLKEGKNNYDALADEASAKYAKVKSGDLGFITAFSVPYEYENIIYNLRSGETSAPYRSRNGVHIFKVIEERKAAGKWQVAQILFAFPPGGNADSPELKHKADSVYKLLKNGEDFAQLAKLYSDDKITYLNGGQMPEFGTGKFQPGFEKEVFTLANNGDFTKPFATAYGLHIVKRISQAPISADKNDANVLFDLKQKVLQDQRIEAAKEKFSKEIISQIGFTKNTAVKDADIYRFADTVAANPSITNVTKFPISNKTIFSFKNAKYTGADWLNFIKDYKRSELYKGENNVALMNRFVSISALEYYRRHLEEYNEAFRFQMAEFKEGNMLFEVMERHVWGNAAYDSLGLLKQYNSNKGKYLWAPSASIIIFNCNNKAAADKAAADVKAGKDWKKIVVDADNTIQADSGRYEISQVALAEGTVPAAGLITAPSVNTIDGTASFVKILQLYPANQQRSFEEARGLVINDYQSVLEDKWITELKKKYPVKVNDAVFNTLLK